MFKIKGRSSWSNSVAPGRAETSRSGERWRPYIIAATIPALVPIAGGVLDCVADLALVPELVDVVGVGRIGVQCDDVTVSVDSEERQWCAATIYIVVKTERGRGVDIRFGERDGPRRDRRALDQ